MTERSDFGSFLPCIGWRAQHPTLKTSYHALCFDALELTTSLGKEAKTAGERKLLENFEQNTKMFFNVMLFLIYLSHIDTLKLVIVLECLFIFYVNDWQYFPGSIPPVVFHI